MLLNKLFNPALLLGLAAGAAVEDECSDLSSPQCCYDAFMDWTASKSSFERATEVTQNYTYSRVQEVYTDVPTTTLCDGFLRYLGPRSGEVSYVTIPADEPVTDWVSTSYPTPRPDCTIKEEDCTPFIEDYITSSMSYRSNMSLPLPTHPHCSTYRRCPAEDDDGFCKLFIDASTVYYWPVTMEGDFCGDRTTVPHPEPTRSTVISGNTFISPSIYLTVENLSAASYAARFTATDCGTPVRDFLLALDPTDVSTHSGQLRRNQQTWGQLNLADMNAPTPATAYFEISEAPDCEAEPEEEACTGVIEATRTPILSVPVQMLRDMDPEFEFCDLWPSSRDAIRYITWIPLEPTQDGYPEATAGPEEEEEEEEEEGQGGEVEEEEGAGVGDEPSVTQIISTTQTLQDRSRFRL